jgi:hypothetical protein
MSPFPCLYASGIPQMENKTTEKVNFSLFSANGKWEWQSFICLLPTEMENRRLFSLETNDNQKTTIAVSANVPIYASLAPWPPVFFPRKDMFFEIVLKDYSFSSTCKFYCSLNLGSPEENNFIFYKVPTRPSFYTVSKFYHCILHSKCLILYPCLKYKINLYLWPDFYNLYLMTIQY